VSEKRQSHFPEKGSLRSVPRLSAESGQFDTHSAQSVFCHAHVAAENDQNYLPPAGGLGSRWRLCRLADAAYPLRV